MDADVTARDPFPLVLLAGGKSSRLGRPKGLVPWGDRPWIEEQLARFVAAGGAKVVVVVGFDDAAYAAALPWFAAARTDEGAEVRGARVTACVNATPDLGPFSSLQCALQTLPEAAGAWVLPIDVPCASAEALAILRARHVAPVQVVVPLFAGGGGHPVRISPIVAAQLRAVPAISPDARLDFQLQALPEGAVARVEVADRSVRKNLNTPDDWDAALRDRPPGRG